MRSCGFVFQSHAYQNIVYTIIYPIKLFSERGKGSGPFVKAYKIPNIKYNNTMHIFMCKQ